MKLSRFSLLLLKFRIIHTKPLDKVGNINYTSTHIIHIDIK